MSAADLEVVGAGWAQYLVDKGLVKAGDFVWMPVEVPGATYGVQEEAGIASVFEPLGITWEVTDATLDQAEIITRMSDYLTANRDQGEGDHRSGRPCDRVASRACSIRSVSSPAKFRSSAGATRSTPRRRC